MEVKVTIGDTTKTYNIKHWKRFSPFTNEMQNKTQIRLVLYKDPKKRIVTNFVLYGGAR